MGDGIGGTEFFEKFIGHASTDQECLDLVRMLEPNANGASRYQLSPYSCFAEFAATGSNSDSTYRTCLFTGQLTLFYIVGKILPYIILARGNYLQTV